MQMSLGVILWPLYCFNSWKIVTSTRKKDISKNIFCGFLSRSLKNQVQKFLLKKKRLCLCANNAPLHVTNSEILRPANLFVYKRHRYFVVISSYFKAHAINLLNVLILDVKNEIQKSGSNGLSLFRYSSV